MGARVRTRRVRGRAAALALTHELRFLPARTAGTQITFDRPGHGGANPVAVRVPIATASREPGAFRAEAAEAGEVVSPPVRARMALEGGGYVGCGVHVMVPDSGRRLRSLK